jgi:hypothetical protein
MVLKSLDPDLNIFSFDDLLYSNQASNQFLGLSIILHSSLIKTLCPEDLNSLKFIITELELPMYVRGSWHYTESYKLRWLVIAEINNQFEYWEKLKSIRKRNYEREIRKTTC